MVSEAGEVMLADGVRTELPKDAHGHPQLSGTGILADYLVYRARKALTPKYGKLRLRGDTFGYLQRSFPGVVSEVDAKEATQVGRLAVKFALTSDVDGSVIIKRKPHAKYAVEISYLPLSKVALGERQMPASFINKAGNNVTRKFIDYAKPLIGTLPKAGLVQPKLIRKR